MEIASNDYNDSEKSKAKAFGEKHIYFNIHSTSRFIFAGRGGVFNTLRLQNFIASLFPL